METANITNHAHGHVTTATTSADEVEASVSNGGTENARLKNAGKGMHGKPNDVLRM